MKTKLLLISFMIIITFNSKNAIAQFQMLTPPCNATGFKTVWCGNADSPKKVLVHQPGYPAFLSQDGGVTWQAVSRGVNPSMPLNCSFLPNDCYEKIDVKKRTSSLATSCDNSYCIAVGKNNTLIQSYNNGVDWIPLPISPQANIPANSEFIDCEPNIHGAKMACAVSKQGYVIYWDGLASCSPSSMINCTEANLGVNINAISTTNLNNVIDPFFCGENGKFFQVILGSFFHNTPSTFIDIPTGTQENLLDCHSLDSYNAIICGTSGTLIKMVYQNGSWQHINIDPCYVFPNGRCVDLYSIAVAPAQNGGGIYVVGDAGVIIKSLDNGNTWSLEASGTTISLRGIDINEDAIYVVGDNNTILKKTW
jgi:hypothetical protein